MTSAVAVDTDHAAEALQHAAPALGLVLSATETALLTDYLSLLYRWNRTYNLTAIRDPQRMISHHLFDCLAAASALESTLGQRPRHVVDIGSGAGLPGLLLAILWRETPVFLVDPVDKKCAFLRHCVAQLALSNVAVIGDRVQNLNAGQFVEQSSARAPGDGLYICRAYTRLSEFAQQVAPLCQPGDWVVAMKSALTNEEVSEFVSESKIKPDSITNSDSNCRLMFASTEELTVPDIDAARSLVFLRAVALST